MEIHSVEEYLAYFQNIRRRTMNLAACVPEQQIEWRPKPRAFSIGDTLRHIVAMERWMFAENVAGRPARYAGCDVDLAEGHAAVIDYMRRMHDESVMIIAALSPDDLRGTCTVPGGAELPVWKWLRAMIEHEVHHRGQIYLMLGMLGVSTPPLYGLTEQQVYDRSIR